MITKEQLAKSLEHGSRESEELEESWILRCKEVKKYGFRSVGCTYYSFPVIRREMEGSGIPILTVVAYPGGLASAKVKITEALQMIDLGVDGVDCVINYLALRSGDLDYVKRELGEFVEAVRKVKPEMEIKFILETTLLTREQIITGSRLVKESGANFVKASTGWRGGCTLEHIRIMREAVGPDFGVKASGGHIATTEKAIAMLEAGADVIGENNCVQIMEGYDLLMEMRSRK